MGLTGTLEVVLVIKSCGDTFHELLRSKPHDAALMTPDNIHGCDLHEGEFGKPGSIINWEYTLEGKKGYCKELIEVVDEEKKLLRYKVIEDENLLKLYKSVNIGVQVIPKGEQEALRWFIEFEKFDDFGPYPANFMDFIIAATRDIEAHHLKTC